jgi:transcriptional regulator with XRE-family HTH domain
MQNIAQGTGMTDSADRLFQRIAARLREARQARGFTQRALAESAAVSLRMVAALEGGESNVSLSTLDRLAHALGLTFAELVGGVTDASPAREPVRVWEGRAPESHGSLLRSARVDGAVELWEWSLAPGERYDAEPDRAGVREWVYVTRGRLTLELGGRRDEVGEGESAAYPSDQEYSYLNEGSETLRFVKNVVG